MGRVTNIALNSAVIEIGGVGLQVNIPVPFATSLRLNSEIQIHTNLVVREDSLTLYGFETAAGKNVFELLQKVSGIGPKVALSALSIYTPEQILNAIGNGNLAELERIPGLGKKVCGARGVGN